MSENIAPLLSVVILRFFFCFFLCFYTVHQLVHSEDKQDYYEDNDKDAKHSLPHILEREQEAVYVEIFKKVHILLLSLTEECAKACGEAEDKSARDDRRYLSRNVYANRVHEQEVLRVFL